MDDLVERLRAEIKLLTARLARMQTALNESRRPEGGHAEYVADWLRSRGYQVSPPMN
jgi:acetylornithine deacetylase/succinyl-diaminopimelate desuccinylase-like protein